MNIPVLYGQWTASYFPGAIYVLFYYYNAVGRAFRAQLIQEIVIEEQPHP